MSGTLTNRGLGEMMAGSFMADLGQFWSDRQERIPYTEIRRSSSYMESDAKVDRLSKVLEVSFTPEQKKAFNDLLDEFTNMESITQDVCYRQGFSDGVKMLIHSLMK